LQDADTNRTVSTQVVYVGPSTPLTIAKAALDAVPGATDIVVTSNGKRDAEMVGWLSNVDLIRGLSAAAFCGIE
jgi:hypothetical protein